MKLNRNVHLSETEQPLRKPRDNVSPALLSHVAFHGHTENFSPIFVKLCVFIKEDIYSLCKGDALNHRGACHRGASAHKVICTFPAIFVFLHFKVVLLYNFFF